MTHPGTGPRERRTIVISGGTDGMGRALAMSRAERGDHVIIIGSNPEKGRRAAAEGERIDFIRSDLSSVADTLRVIREIGARHQVVDALCLFANRQSPHRTVTAEGLEQTFALYYLSRYLLGRELGPMLSRSRRPVIVNVAGVGMTKGSIHWDDLQLEHRYSTVTAQLQAGRANDLLGVAHARARGPVPYVLYHPGLTRSGDLSPLPGPARAVIRAAAAMAGRPIERSLAPVHEFIDSPPRAALTARDRGRDLPLTLATLDPVDAERLVEATRSLLAGLAPAADT